MGFDVADSRFSKWALLNLESIAWKHFKWRYYFNGTFQITVSTVPFIAWNLTSFFFIMFPTYIFLHDGWMDGKASSTTRLRLMSIFKLSSTALYNCGSFSRALLPAATLAPPSPLFASGWLSHYVLRATDYTTHSRQASFRIQVKKS
jgi:hypothetical protein